MGENLIQTVREIHRIRCGTVPFVLEAYSELFANIIPATIKQRKYDVIIARDYYVIAYLKVQTPIIYIGDTTYDLFKAYCQMINVPQNPYSEYIEKKAIANSNLIIYASEWAKKNVISHYKASASKIKVIEFGANLDDTIIPRKIAPINTSSCNLLFIAKNWIYKGGEKAYSTYLLLKEQGINCSLTIIGCQPKNIDQGDNQVKIIPFIDKANSHDKILLDEILRTTHFFILPSLFDCLGIVFCEASAYGIPSIASDVGGIHQVIRNGLNGFLLPAQADSKKYAQIISSLWTDPETYNKLRVTSRKEFENRLNWNIWEQKMNLELNQLIKTQNMDNNSKGIYIPTYVINLQNRIDRKQHILKEFQSKDEFELKIIEACTHPVGAIGLWNSIVKIIKEAIRNDDDAIIICEDDHYFTENYSSDYLLDNILGAFEQGADILSGGIGGFGYAVPVAKNRYWVDWIWCTQFIVVYKKFYHKILEYNFLDTDTADGVISKLSNNIMTLYPFISRQKEFGYSDITQGNKDNPHLITLHFERANTMLARIHQVSTFYNYPEYPIDIANQNLK